MTNKNENGTDPMFDGHLEKDITRMNTREKLLYISMQIQLKHYIANKVKKVSKPEN